jgi:[acyl-carrier-protein] S-malonyltransferase
MAKSVTLLFPGQGSQYVGMGEGLKDHHSFNFFNRANEALDFDLQKTMLEGPEEDLKLTANTQPAIVTHSVALFDKVWEILINNDIKIDRVLGHSVGEYSALVAARAIDFEDAVRAVNLRGKYMQEAVPVGAGKMMAVMKVPVEKIEQACKEVSVEGDEVMPANYNEPNQIVISGHANACDRAKEWLEKNISDPFRVVELKVSAPFHSSLMEPAAKKLKAEFANIKSWRQPEIPYIANINAQEYNNQTSPETIQDNLFKQVDGPVLWTQSIQQLPDDTVCLEVGPGRVLMGLVRKINRNIKVISLDKDGAFDNLIEEIQS